MVGAGEGALTHLAFEGLGSRVLPVVSGELVRSREPPLTFWPVTPVGFFTCGGQWRREGEYKIIMKLKIGRYLFYLYLEGEGELLYKCITGDNWCVLVCIFVFWVVFLCFGLFV